MKISASELKVGDVILKPDGTPMYTPLKYVEPEHGQPGDTHVACWTEAGDDLRLMPWEEVSVKREYTAQVIVTYTYTYREFVDARAFIDWDGISRRAEVQAQSDGVNIHACREVTEIEDWP